MINADKSREMLYNNTVQSLSFGEEKPFDEWKAQLKAKLTELIGLPIIAENTTDEVNFNIEQEEQKDGYKQIRFTFDSEKNVTIPCYILIPDNLTGKAPLAITLQGHNTGMYNSVGIIKTPRDEEGQPRKSLAVQAVKRGYVAVAMEQRGMGELQSSKAGGRNCYDIFTTQLLLGRTLIGERVWDVMHLIDLLLERFNCIDGNKIVITGNSGGGTTSFYAACIDERIKISAPSCAFCPYRESILFHPHCGCNYIPQAYRFFDMQDLSALIAPRQLIIVSGKEDSIFLIEGVLRGYETVKKIFEKAGAPENCRQITTPMPHWWCEDIVWPAIDNAIKKL